MGKREQESEGEEVSVEDEENGRGSICEAAGGNCELGLTQIGKIVICVIRSSKNLKKTTRTNCVQLQKKIVADQ